MACLVRLVVALVVAASALASCRGDRSPKPDQPDESSAGKDDTPSTCAEETAPAKAYLIRIDAEERIFERGADGKFQRRGDEQWPEPNEVRASSIELVVATGRPSLAALHLAPERKIWFEVTVEEADPRTHKIDPNAESPALLRAEGNASWSDSFADVVDASSPVGEVERILGESGSAQVYEHRLDATTDAGKKLTFVNTARVSYVASDTRSNLRGRTLDTVRRDKVEP
jgi:hypothetical protein